MNNKFKNVIPQNGPWHPPAPFDSGPLQPNNRANADPLMWMSTPVFTGVFGQEVLIFLEADGYVPKL